MGDSMFASEWQITEAKNKVAALSPKLSTMHRTFLLGAANIIWYKDPLLICRDLCLFKVSMLFPEKTKLNQSMVGVLGFKFKTPKE